MGVTKTRTGPDQRTRCADWSTDNKAAKHGPDHAVEFTDSDYQFISVLSKLDMRKLREPVFEASIEKDRLQRPYLLEN